MQLLGEDQVWCYYITTVVKIPFLLVYCLELLHPPKSNKLSPKIWMEKANIPIPHRWPSQCTWCNSTHHIIYMMFPPYNHNPNIHLITIEFHALPPFFFVDNSIIKSPLFWCYESLIWGHTNIFQKHMIFAFQKTLDTPSVWRESFSQSIL